MIKKIISRILTVTLLASCITFSSHKSVVEAEELEVNLSNSQIVEQGGENKVDSDKVTTSKTIVETGVENEFEITLQVTTEEDIKNISLSPDAATVLVLDRSTSMNERSGSTTRFQAMKTAAKGFLTEFANVEAESNAKRLVSIVSFATDVKNETYESGENIWIDVTSNLSSAEGKINSIQNPNGWTNIEGALLMANNIVKDGKSKGLLNGSDGNVISNINIILLTDGSPTAYASNSNSTSINTMSGVTSGSTNSSTTATWKPVGGTVNGVQANTNNIAKTIKDSRANLYTIAFSTTSVGFYYDNSRSVQLNPSTWMSTFATRNFLANDASELTEQFEKISKLIALSAQAWNVTDPMGENIIYKEIEEESGNNSYSFDNNILKWDIKNSDSVESTTEQGNKKYTYTLKYRAILDTTKEDVNYDYVATNGETILDYYLFSKQGEDESLELKHANFNVPKVKGLFGGFNFTKFDENNKVMKDVSFTLSGTATGSNKAVVKTVISDSNGYVSFSKIPAGVYTLTEATPSGYIAAGPWNVGVAYGNTTKDATLGDSIINYPAARNINVEKKWSGLPDGKTDLPEGVTVRLYKNGVETDNSLVLNKVNEWKGSFTNLPFIDENGVITYSVKEDKVLGYETAIERDENGNKFTITNSYNPELIKISGIKTWVDESGNNIEGEVPDILITLQRTTADNWDDESKIEDVESITLISGETQYIFENLPKTDTNSNEYKYRVRESKVNGYESKYNEEFDIINTYSPGETELTVNKVWNNVDVENDILPEVTAVLYQNGKVFRTEVLNKVNGYRYTFTNLPKYAKTGAEYIYTVKEDMKEGTVGYSSEELVNEDGSVTITNTFDTTKVDILGLKKWESVPIGAEVPSVTLRLHQNGVEIKVITLTSGIKESEEYSFKNLPRYSTEGKEYTYTVIEETTNGYISSGEGNVSNDYIITNTFTNESITVMGEKTWSNVEDKDLNTVPIITIKLESSLDKGETWSEVAGKVIELTAGNTKYEFENLPKYASDSREYSYRVVETPITGYITSENGSYNILNTYTPGETSIKVTKKWTNVDPNTDKVPQVNIILKQNEAEVDRIVLDKENEYTHIFEKLDKYAPTGEEYIYTIEEVLSDDVVGYTKEIISGEDGFVIENIFDRNATVDIPFIKIWENVTDNSKVPEIKLHLYQDGVELKDKAVTLKGGIKENRIESYLFKDLPKYATEGKEYVYTVIEETVMGYKSSGEANASNNYTITNIFTPESIDISGKKTWSNVSEEDLSKVPTIKILLESSTDGIMWAPVEGRVLELTAGNAEYSFDNLPKYSVQGNKYKYRVVEEAINGYKALYDLEYNIINIYTPEETSVKVTKKWTNVDPNTDKVPEVEISLKQNGTEINSVVLDEENGYSHTFENLAKYDITGEEYIYTIEEVLSDDVIGYEKNISSENNEFTVENIFNKDAIVDIQFNKVWKNISEDSEVPEIKLHLYQNGVELKDKVVTLDGGIKENGREKYVYENLPRYSTDGKEYVYTIKEDSINGYTSSGEANEANEYTITNTYDGGEKVPSISDVKTGDNSMMILYASLAIISLSLISIMVLRKRRRTMEK
ncbi:Cna B-type domain-containing protein [Clostridium sp. AL.422]|uniref:Cna B-type domain-containing protein n=1 Tax=Clostridium TaxID=1485 RepID=UPI00293DC3B8|nr:MULTISPECIES: Cna B-type domain-containing protein [unclassified Clostridium]MDV4150138.1 Cna B-type domain-containing protein [Clostridium sp. AL.422]